MIIGDVMKWREAGTLDKHIASGGSRKKHKHFHSPTFKSRCVWLVFPTPAEYRRQHAGVHK